MKLKTIISLTILIGCIVLDQATKQWGRGLSTLYYNEGLILGLFANSPASFRIIALSSFAGFILLFYFFLLSIVSHRAYWFKYGASFLVGGVCGNVVDKIVLGKTIDFIPLGTMSVVFNVADIFQWSGVVILVWFLFAREELIWHPDSSRQNYLVRPREQLKMALQFLFTAFFSSLILGIFSFTFFNTLFGEAMTAKLKVIFFITYGCLSLLFCSIVFIMGIVISHRTAGPLYAFEMYVEDLLANKDRKLSLREGDNYRHFEKVADRLRERFKS